MRIPYFSLLAILGLYIVATAPGFTDAPAPGARVPVRAPAKVTILPDPTLTPGAVLPVDVAKICTPGYARAATHTDRALRLAIYAAYHIAPNSGQYVIDHLIPVELGGADVVENLWPEEERVSGRKPGDKQRLANFLYRQVCAGRIPLHQAQVEMAGNWLAAYRKYFGKF